MTDANYLENFEKDEPDKYEQLKKECACVDFDTHKNMMTYAKEVLYALTKYVDEERLEVKENSISVGSEDNGNFFQFFATEIL